VTAAGPRRAAVLGSPIAHSLSPALHRAAYSALVLPDWTYDAYDVTQLTLPGFLAELDLTWAGLSLTMPLKAAVLDLLDEASQLASAVGAANTVLLRDGRRRGENTDVPGIVAALHEQGVDRVPTATVLGGGATARSVVAALAGVAGSVTAYVRSTQRAEELQAVADATGAALRVEAWEGAPGGLGADLVVNTTVAGAADPLADRLPDATTTLFEVLYEPWPTALAAAWSERGGQVVNGLDLLVHQAVLQVVLMTRATVDVPALVPVLRAAGQRALTAR
jgi:shikimate dehydrogenase